MAIPAVIANLSMYQGEDRSFQDTIFQDDGVSPEDLTGWTIQFTIFAYGDPTTIFVQKDNSSGVVLNNPTQGKVLIPVVHSDTVNMYADQLEFKVFRTDPGNNVYPTRGLFTLLRA